MIGKDPELHRDLQGETPFRGKAILCTLREGEGGTTIHPADGEGGLLDPFGGGSLLGGKWLWLQKRKNFRLRATRRKNGQKRVWEGKKRRKAEGKLRLQESRREALHKDSNPFVCMEKSTGVKKGALWIRQQKDARGLLKDRKKRTRATGRTQPISEGGHASW